MIKFISFVLVLLLLNACQLGSLSNVKQVQCSNPRPEMCTMDYVPVCGFNKENVSNTYSNACTACSDAKVVSYAKEEC